jgi:hypothetical protein
MARVAPVADLFPLSSVYSQPGYLYPYRPMFASMPVRAVTTTLLTSSASNGRPVPELAPLIASNVSVETASGRRDSMVTTVDGQGPVVDERKPQRPGGVALDVQVRPTTTTTTTHSETSVPAPTLDVASARREDRDQERKGECLSFFFFHAAGLLTKRISLPGELSTSDPNANGVYIFRYNREINFPRSSFACTVQLCRWRV